MLDLGSNNGYFSLQTAAAFPESVVIGIEGSVGVGNGSVGTSRCDWKALSKTGAVRTHLRWIRKLQLQNCAVAPEVWDYDSVRTLVESGLCVDAMLSLSVVHHIDNYSADKKKMPSKGPVRLKATMDLLSDLMKLAWVHVIELPDRPWLDHVHDAFEGDPKAILEAVCKRTGFQWEMRKIYENAWIGHRELWFLRRTEQRNQPNAQTRIGLEEMSTFFPMMLPSKDPDFEAWMQENASVIDATPRPLGDRRQSRLEAAQIVNAKDSLAISGGQQFLQSALLGQWTNEYGDDIELLPNTTEEPKAWANYSSRGRHPITWKADQDQRGGSWILTNHGGVFHLEAASARTLVWTRRDKDPFTTSWERVSERTR
jgi:hypothetical protein